MSVPQDIYLNLALCVKYREALFHLRKIDFDIAVCVFLHTYVCCL